MDTKKIRSLVNVLPTLVKASYIAQAEATKKLIIASFDPSAEFKETTRNIPQNYLEKINEQYKQYMFKAFQAGYEKAKASEDCFGLSPKMAEDDLRKEVKVSHSIPVELSQDFSKAFTEEIKSSLETYPGKEEIYAQFSKDLACAFECGIIEFVQNCKEPAKMEIKEEKKEEKKEENQEKSAAEIKPEDESIKVESKAKATSAVGPVSKDLIVKKMSEYAKLLGDEHAEMVLRYTLGLGPKTAFASVDEKDEKGEKGEEAEEVSTSSTDMIAAYSPEDLKERILDMMTSYDHTDEEVQCIKVDCLMSDLDELGDKAPEAVVKKLGLDPLLEQADLSMEDVLEACEVLAEELTKAVGLPGQFCFCDEDGSFCLWYCFEKEEAAEIAEESGAVVTAKAKKATWSAPMGVLSKSHQEEIKKIAQSYGPNSKVESYKELKKISPKLASFISEALSKMRTGEYSLKEGCAKVQCSVAEMIKQCYGDDGQKYFEFIKKEKVKASAEFDTPSPSTALEMLYDLGRSMQPNVYRGRQKSKEYLEIIKEYGYEEAIKQFKKAGSMIESAKSDYEKKLEKASEIIHSIVPNFL